MKTLVDSFFLKQESKEKKPNFYDNFFFEVMKLF